MLKITNLKWAILFSAILLACVIWIIVSNGKSALYAEIYVDGSLYKAIDNIDSEEILQLRVATKYGENIIEYGRGEICVKSSDCENQTCVNFGKISSAGQTIICAPHRLTVKLVGGGDSADAVL